jgi:hypothetical protein
VQPAAAAAATAAAAAAVATAASDKHLRARLPQVYNLEPPTQGKVRSV